ncbi:small, acid-soluble spore protein, alpha/beta type [Bacillus sp. FJAT-45350]|uniref:small, acid-soluble spore protein, alpha/beta type n=1 Tax=Bacillus sp. FJAT-45350 TaxID=2011014 RepID=UPI000BB9056B|nr:small, acid-soluble spore protein, alpha/beta type [Bacillus sp. FJAT-45350]
MTMKNLLLVPESEAFVEQYKEEIASEFGIYRSTQEIDAMSKDMTKALLKKKEKDAKEDTK